jgi:ABC-type sulfate/molybdate transport systems ATPase subunit
VIGPNGSGKTTALRLWAGLGSLPGHRPDGLSGAFDGPGGPRLPVTWVPQDPHLFPHRTVRQQVEWVAAPRTIAGDGELAGWVDRLGLGRLLDRRPHQLSGGQQQRAALLRAVAARPRVMALDEALAQIDAVHRLEVWEGLREWAWARPGRLVIVTSHTFAEVAEQVDRVAVLWEGRLLSLDAPAALRRAPGSWAVASLVGYQAWSPGAALGRPGPQGLALAADVLRLADRTQAGATVPATVVARDGGGVWVELKVAGAVGRRRFWLPAPDAPDPPAPVTLAVDGPWVQPPA